MHVVNFDDDSEVPNELRGVHGVAHNRQRRESSDGFTEEGGAETRSKRSKRSPQKKMASKTLTMNLSMFLDDKHRPAFWTVFSQPSRGNLASRSQRDAI